MGVKFDSVTLSQSIENAMDIIERHECGYVVTPNPEILWMCRNEPSLLAALNAADMVLPDGVGVMYSAKILNKPLEEKVSGVDFGIGLIKRLAEAGKSIYLLGAKPGVAQAAASELRKDYSGIEIKGLHHGFFDDDEEIIGEINDARPDFLMVCLGAPRQEKWMLENKGKLDVGIMAGLGGVLDVLSGTAKRAPQSWQDKNLEWLYRLLKEPKRIKRQIKIPLFLLTVIGRRMRDGDEDGER